MQVLDPMAPVLLSPRVRVDLSRQQLWRDGLPVALRPKAWQALDYLARRPGTLVSGPALLDALWSNQDVSAKTMANLVSELRIALGDDQTPPQLLSTVHRRGHRLLAQADVAPPVAPVSPAVLPTPAAQP